MTSPTQAEIEAAYDISLGTIELRLYFAATALCCYDYCLTLVDEIRYVWRAKQSSVTLLFYAFRYTAVLNTVFMILDAVSFPSWHNPVSCAILVLTEMAFNIILLSNSALFASKRVYAVFDRNRWVFMSTLVLGLLNPAVSLYTFTLVTPALAAYLPSTCGYYLPPAKD